MNILFIIIGFLLGFFIISKIIDITKRKINSDKINSTMYKSYTDNNSIDQDLLLNVLNILGMISTSNIYSHKNDIRAIVYAFIKNNFNSNNLENISIENMLLNGRNNSESLEFLTHKLINVFKCNKKFLLSVSQLLLDVALFNNKLSNSDELIIIRYCNEAHIENENPYKLFKESNEKKYYYNNSNTSQMEKDKYYGEILGLSGKIRKEEITRIYRELALKYHPDRIEHLGVEFIKLAESKFKEINTAYEYFKSRYDLE